jgi:Short C-terminal domain
MRDLGRARGVSGLGDSPGLSCAAWILGGFFLIPLIWTIVTTTIRVARAQRVTHQPVLNGWLAAVVWIFTLGLGGFVFTQYQLNKAWSGEPEAPPPGGVPAGDADLDRLAKLRELHESGALSDDEFEVEKGRILPKSSAEPGVEPPAEGTERSRD